MMTAQEAFNKANSISNLKLQEYIQRAEKAIENAILANKMSVMIDTTGLNDNQSGLFIKTFSANGYTVKQDKGSDQRDGPWNQMTISWANPVFGFESKDDYYGR